MSKPTVFVSYSHRDRGWKDRLVHHLEVLERKGLLDVWEDSRIAVGTEWRPEIEGAIARARVAVLLVSVDFLRSDFIRNRVVPEFLARRKAEGLHVFPVIVRSCAWEHVDQFASIQARPRDGKALADFRGNRTERELVEIAREILHLAEMAPSAPKPPSVPLAPNAPLHQLPAPPADFIGRIEDLSAIRASVPKGGATICGLQGQGGVGKTALALVLAHEMAADFPEAQIFLDLQGVSDRPLASADAMAHVVRSFFPDAKLPEGPQLVAAYRDVLAGKRVLLLMDNASGHDQIEPLVPPVGCALLVTSRQRFTLPGLAVRDLDLLPEEDACELLLAITPRIGERAGEIARLCGYLPFALRIAAGTLVERPDLSVEVFEKRLGGEKERAAIGEKVLGVSYSLLADAFQERFRHLAVFAGDFDAPAASAVWELGHEVTDETLGAFVRGSLIEGKNGRYKLHDLTRVFASSQLSEDEKARGGLRHAEHYCAVLREANLLYQQGNEHLLAGLTLFDRERNQIVAGQTWAEREIQTEESARLASQYPDAGAFALEIRLSPRNRISWFEAGCEGARWINDRAAEGHHLGSLGSAYADLGETRRAIEYYELCLIIAHEIGDQHSEAAALSNLGLAHAELGEPQCAIEYYEKALVIAREIGNRRMEGNILGNLGLAHSDLGEPVRAIEHYEQRLTIARQIGDRRGEGSTFGNLGIAYRVLGKTRLAIEYHERFLVIAREFGDRHGEAHAHTNLGIAYNDLGNTRRAIEHYEQALTSVREIGDRRGEGINSWNLGLAYENLGELARAVELMQIFVDYERELGYPDAEEHATHVESIRARLADG